MLHTFCTERAPIHELLSQLPSSSSQLSSLSVELDTGHSWGTVCVTHAMTPTSNSTPVRGKLADGVQGLAALQQLQHLSLDPSLAFLYGSEILQGLSGLVSLKAAFACLDISSLPSKLTRLDAMVAKVTSSSSSVPALQAQLQALRDRQAMVSEEMEAVRRLQQASAASKEAALQRHGQQEQQAEGRHWVQLCRRDQQYIWLGTSTALQTTLAAYDKEKDLLAGHENTLQQAISVQQARQAQGTPLAQLRQLVLAPLALSKVPCDLTSALHLMLPVLGELEQLKVDSLLLYPEQLQQVADDVASYAGLLSQRENVINMQMDGQWPQGEPNVDQMDEGQQAQQDEYNLVVQQLDVVQTMEECVRLLGGQMEEGEEEGGQQGQQAGEWMAPLMGPGHMMALWDGGPMQWAPPLAAQPEAQEQQPAQQQAQEQGAEQQAQQQNAQQQPAQPQAQQQPAQQQPAQQQGAAQQAQQQAQPEVQQQEQQQGAEQQVQQQNNQPQDVEQQEGAQPPAAAAAAAAPPAGPSNVEVLQQLTSLQYLHLGNLPPAAQPQLAALSRLRCLTLDLLVGAGTVQQVVQMAQQAPHLTRLLLANPRGIHQLCSLNDQEGFAGEAALWQGVVASVQQGLPGCCVGHKQL